MNGFGLLLVLSSLGVTAGIELTPSGQQIYVIYVESLVAGEMRNGQEVQTIVAVKDRGVRHFRITVIPDSGARSSRSNATSFGVHSENLVKYEPVQLDNGEIEYWVQIAPERLETLVAGKPIEGDIASEIPQVHRFRVFVGVNRLPSQQDPRNGAMQVPYLLAGNDGAVAPAGVNSSSGLSAPPRQTQFQTPAQTANNRTAAWRNPPDNSPIGPPPFATATQPGYSSGATLAQRNPTATDRSGFVTQPQYPTQPPYDPNAYAYQGQQQQTYPQNLQQPPVTTVAARQEPVATGPQSMVTLPAATATSATSVAAVDERPWTPLILTTLALFASLGANAYLGWLAWSFFWRFRDAVTESARTRSHFTSRQAA